MADESLHGSEEGDNPSLHEDDLAGLNQRQEIVQRLRNMARSAVQRRYEECMDEERLRDTPGPGLTFRIEELKVNYKTFQDKHSEYMELAHDAQLVDIEVDAEQVTQWYFNAATALQGMIEEKRQTQGAPISSQDSQIIRVQTPRRIDIGKFNGDFAAWPSFRDLFEAEVLNNDSLQDVEKLIYLQRACTGVAHLAVNGWAPLAQNFTQAYKDLKEKFEDPYQLQQALISKMMAVPVMQQETYGSLRTVLDTCLNTLRQLERMGIQVDNWDVIMINVIVSRLPVSTIDAWEQKRITMQKVSLKELISFLEGKARGRAHLDKRLESTQKAEIKNDAHKRSDRNGPSSDKKNNRDQRPNTSTPQELESSGQKITDYSSIKCRYCGGPHPVFRCENDLLKNPKEKIPGLLASKGICSNCLRIHPLEKCTGMPCPRCPNERHNSIVCPKYVSRHVPSVHVIQQDKTAGRRAHPYKA